MGFLRHSFPELAESYERLYPGAYAPPEYAASVRALIQMIQERYRVNLRARRKEPGSTPNSQRPTPKETATPNSQRPTPNSQGSLFGNWELGLGS